MNKIEELKKIQDDMVMYFNDHYISNIGKKLSHYQIESIDFKFDIFYFQGNNSKEVKKFRINNSGHILYEKLSDYRGQTISEFKIIDTSFLIKPEYITQVIELISDSLEREVKIIDDKILKAGTFFNKMKTLND